MIICIYIGLFLRFTSVFHLELCMDGCILFGLYIFFVLIANWSQIQRSTIVLVCDSFSGYSSDPLALVQSLVLMIVVLVMAALSKRVEVYFERRMQRWKHMVFVLSKITSINQHRS
ncbi:hypothetical protein PanWU01x14_211900 [Parasponia andersonii]|uniref:Uncharacterized protein n=1 Tax=Parasponia andersonii TaxID=3476 RepID=A0A2P5BTI7_PARAD|nr:hypothetical protein PanWU01x14_211900 [Parasponia andersonii]